MDKIDLLIISFVFTVMIHHYMKHTELELPHRLFEVKDVSNHETWLLAAIFFGIGRKMSL